MLSLFQSCGLFAELLLQRRPGLRSSLQLVHRGNYCLTRAASPTKASGGVVRTNQKTHINPASLKVFSPTIRVSWALEYEFQLLHQSLARTAFSVEHKVFIHWVPSKHIHPLVLVSWPRNVCVCVCVLGRGGWRQRIPWIYTLYYLY